jgi:hypothetical protein
MTVAISDPFGFGVDIAALDDLSPVWGLVGGELTVAYDLYRRITTPAGSYDEIEDEPIDTLDIRGFLNARVSQAITANLKSRLAAVCKGNPRVRSCSPDISYNMARRELRVDLHCETATGPFDMVLAATAVTVEILSINGRPAPSATPSITAVTQVIAVQGEKGDPGPAGVSGESGTPADTLDFGDEQQSVSSGAEEVVFQRQVRFGDLPGSLTVAMTCQLRSASGTSAVKVRVGGSKSTADGTIVNSATTASASFVDITDTDALVNPTGTLWVKVTVQNAVAGQPADIEYARVTIR